MAIRKFALRLIIGLLIAAPIYIVAFTIYACQGNLGCTAMALPDTVNALLGRPIYPNFLTATGGPEDNLPVTLHPAPSLLHLALLTLAVAFTLQIIVNRKPGRILP
jgi:hypothetical protein